MTDVSRPAKQSLVHAMLAVLAVVAASLGRVDAATLAYQPVQPVSNQPLRLTLYDVVPHSGFLVGPHAAKIEGQSIRVEGCIGSGGFAAPGDYTAHVTVTPLPPGEYVLQYYRTFCGRFVPPFQLVGTWTVTVSEPPPGQPAVPMPPSEAYQYWHAGFDHYFFTVNDEEKLAIETGQFVGWERIAPYNSTASAFRFGMFSDSSDERTPVCRFFTERFAPRSSHFYAIGQDECDLVRSNADWNLEGVVGYVYPTAADGSCTRGVPLYRLYNRGRSGAPNHRYTIDRLARAEMIRKGWQPEGTGAGVVACVPNVDP